MKKSTAFTVVALKKEKFKLAKTGKDNCLFEKRGPRSPKRKTAQIVAATTKNLNKLILQNLEPFLWLRLCVCG